MMIADLTSAAFPLEAARTSTSPAPVVVTAQVISILRSAGAKLGLSPQVLRSLELLLSFLPPKRNHHMVFASNETLVHRAQGLHERSLRRHIAALAEAGLLQRSDSPNRKRYSCHDPLAGRTLRFGLDLGPLFARLPELETLAQEATEEMQQLRYLRRKLRAAAQRQLIIDPTDSHAMEAMKAARRRISVAELTALLTELPSLSETTSLEEPPLLSNSAGQNDRHLPSFNKEYIEKNTTETLISLKTATPEALHYALSPIETTEDVEQHAQMLAPMLGITLQLYQQAVAERGAWSVASLIWMIVEDARRILKPAAYFRSLTLGAKAGTYRAWEWISRVRANCPRTI